MRTQLALCAAFALILPALAAGQEANAPAAKAGEVTVIGCLQREADFRSITRGRGGVPGSGVGVAGAYVLSGALPSDTSRNSRMRPRAANQGDTAHPVGTSGTGTHYNLTGTLDENRLRDVGRLVEIVGTVEQPASSDALPRLTITAWHSVGDLCPPK